MTKAIWFDMDGTIYNLYKIPGWLERIQNNDMTVFDEDGYARKSLPRIREVICQLRAEGWTVGIITWAPMGVDSGSLEFRNCYSYKAKWVRKNAPELLENFYCVEYGHSKRTVVQPSDLNVLVDDNKAVRQDWKDIVDHMAINATHGFIKELEGLLM